MKALKVDDRAASRLSDCGNNGLQRGPGEDGQATRVALMEAAVRLLQRDGVLAGLNISEVAKEVGVTPANIYHYFKSRQGLLRAAINHRTALLGAGGEQQRLEMPWRDRTLAGFEFVLEHPELSLVALLALDEDDEFKVAPFLDSLRSVVRRDAAAGDLVPDVDHEVMHMVFVAMEYGYSIFAAGTARQLGLELDELHGRARVVVERMVAAFAPPRDDTPPV